MADTLEIFNCPLCGNEMKKVYLNEQKMHIDICLDGCGGIFLDNREFEKIDDAHENVDEIIASIEGKVFEKVEASAQKICPVCNVPMVEIGAGKGNVRIDYCNGCGAKFLDNGELQRIRESETTRNEKIDGIMQAMFEDNLKDVTYGLAPRVSSSRRQVFENFITRFI